MFKYNKWKVVQTTGKSGKLYSTCVCPKCEAKTVLKTNYCAHCGKRMIKGGK